MHSLCGLACWTTRLRASTAEESADWAKEGTPRCSELTAGNQTGLMRQGYGRWGRDAGRSRDGTLGGVDRVSVLSPR